MNCNSIERIINFNRYTQVWHNYIESPRHSRYKSSSPGVVTITPRTHRDPRLYSLHLSTCKAAIISFTMDHFPPGSILFTNSTTVSEVQQPIRVFTTARATTSPSPRPLIEAWRISWVTPIFNVGSTTTKCKSITTADEGSSPLEEKVNIHRNQLQSIKLCIHLYISWYIN